MQITLETVPRLYFTIILNNRYVGIPANNISYLLCVSSKLFGFFFIINY